MRTFALASGSSGNCYYIESECGLKILVDIGLSFKRTKQILESRGVDISEIDALFITHEHGDHSFGLSNFSKNTNSKVYISQGTLDALGFGLRNFEIIKNHSLVDLGGIKVFALSKPHDSKEALAFVFESRGKKVGVFTDLGYATGEIKHILKGLDILYFEANYCRDVINEKKRLFANNYVARSISDEGHLDLEESCEILMDVAADEQKIILSHISQNTNTYELTYNRIKERLGSRGKFPEIFVSFQKEPTDWFE